MAASISTAEQLPEADYSVPHRSPPQPPPQQPPPKPPVQQQQQLDAELPAVHIPPPAPTASIQVQSTAATAAPAQAQIPSIAYDATHAPANGSTASAHDEQPVAHTGRTPRRQTSFGAFLRRSSSRHSQQRSTLSESPDAPPPVPSAHLKQKSPQGAGSLAPLPGIPTQAPQKRAGRMLRSKASMRKEQERARLEEEERQRQRNRSPPRLPLPPTVSAPLPPGHGLEANNNTTSFDSSTAPTMATPTSSPAYALRSGIASSATPSPAAGFNGEYVRNPARRSESITNRSRYSYASSMGGINIDSPRRIRRRKDPTPFNLLVIGAKNSGKTSLLAFLRHSLSMSTRGGPSPVPENGIEQTRSAFTSHYVETEMDGERVGMTLWDSAGLEKHIIDLQLREMVAFVESKFEETFMEEQKVMRSPNLKDTHIHCVLLVLDPVRLDATVAASGTTLAPDGVTLTANGLDEDLDLQVMRALWGKTTVIPVIAKADTLTAGHIAFLKRAVWGSIKGAKLDPLDVLRLDGDLDEEDEDAYSDSDASDNNSSNYDNAATTQATTTSKPTNGHHRRQSSMTIPFPKPPNNDTTVEEETPALPMSILSPDPYDLPPFTPPTSHSNQKIGRRFAWGIADPFDPQHCDFIRLRNSVFSEWRVELRDLARTKWYEDWRTSRLKNLPAARLRQSRVGSTASAATTSAGNGGHAAAGGIWPSTTAAMARDSFSSPIPIRARVSSSGAGTAAAAAVPRTVPAVAQTGSQATASTVAALPMTAAGTAI